MTFNIPPEGLIEGNVGPVDPALVKALRIEVSKRAAGRKGWIYLSQFGVGQVYRVKDGTVLWTMATHDDGRPWLHASRSAVGRVPTYAEMVELHRVIIGDRYAYSVWPPSVRHVNLNPNVLHMWALIDGGPEPLPDFTGGGNTL